MVIVSGRAVVEVDEERFELAAGDALRFDPSKPHRTTNPGPEPVVYVSASTPPSF
jgi:mannose-6-phosphate isomerase-like protein (cupin superfamily)